MRRLLSSLAGVGSFWGLILRFNTCLKAFNRQAEWPLIAELLLLNSTLAGWAPPDGLETAGVSSLWSEDVGPCDTRRRSVLNLFYVI